MPEPTTIDPDDPVDYLTNVPGLIGFYPSESLVLVIRDGDDDPGPLLVRDLPGDADDAVSSAELHEAVAVAAEQMSDDGYAAADVYVISRRWARGADGMPWWSTILGALADGGLAPNIFAGAAAVRAGEKIIGLGGGVFGVVGDPSGSAAARLLHAAGEHIAARSGDLRDRFRPEPAGLRVAAGEALRRAGDDVIGIRRAGGGVDGAELDDVRRYHLTWLMLVEAVHRGDVTVEEALGNPEHLRTLARPLVSLLLRDMAMGSVLDESEPTVRALWLGCARLFRGTARANALACYAMDRQMFGSPSVARAALDAALETDPTHSLSMLLGAAFASGRSDIAIRSMLEATAAFTGDVLPDDGAVA